MNRARVNAPVPRTPFTRPPAASCRPPRELRDRAPRPSFLLPFLLASLTPAFAAGASATLLLDAAVNAHTIVSVGERGTILRSEDSGAAWASVPAPTFTTLTAIGFAPDTAHGWAVGHDALILFTPDAGRTWETHWQGSNLEDSFLDVLALDSRHVLAVGAYGLFVETRNAGKTWTPRKIVEDDMHLNRITRGPTDTLYVAGERGTLLRSHDRGETWRRLESPYAGSFYGVLPLGPRTLLAYGLRGHVFRSIDDGDTWAPIPLDRPMFIATAVKTRAGTLVLAGQSRALYVSRDDGASFSAAPSDFTTAVAELIEAPNGTLLAFGEAGASPLTVGGALRPDSSPAQPSPAR